MLCYKDMSFCTAKDCTNMECNRNTSGPNFNPDDWWKDKVAYAAFKEKCKEYRKGDKKDE